MGTTKDSLLGRLRSFKKLDTMSGGGPSARAILTELDVPVQIDQDTDSLEDVQVTSPNGGSVADYRKVTKVNGSQPSTERGGSLVFPVSCDFVPKAGVDERDRDDQNERRRMIAMSGALSKESGEPSLVREAPLDTLRRTVSQDYPVPKWMVRRKMINPDYKCPYHYHQTFLGKHGLINYKATGNPEARTVVLCIHGLNGNRLTFQDFQTLCGRYKSRYCFISFDLYGHGLSASPKYQKRGSRFCCRKEPATYSLEFFVLQAEEVLEHLGITEDRPLILVGFSMGGVVAVAFAAKHLGWVQKLVLISSAGFVSIREPLPVKCLKHCTCLIRCAPRCVCGCCCNKKRFLKRFPAHERENGHAEALWYRLVWQLFVKKGMIQSFLGSVAGVPLWNAKAMFEKVGQTNLPVLLLSGRQDTVTSPISAQKVHRCFSNSHLVMFENGTHLVPADQPQATAALLLTFFDFPANCSLDRWHYLFPFTALGEYVPKEKRCPPQTTFEDYLRELNFIPRVVFHLSPTLQR